VSLGIQAGKIPKDWSFVAWGEHSPIFVYNQDGSKSAHFAMSEMTPKRPPLRKDKDSMASWPSSLDLENPVDLTESAEVLYFRQWVK